LVGWLFLTGTPQRVRRIRGADINADLIYLIVPQYTAGGQYPLSSAAARTGDCGIVITGHKTVEEQKRPSARFARPWVVRTT
jgi:hypothetical protein